jgi:hypothetical protein
LNLLLLHDAYTVCRLPPDSQLPEWARAPGDDFISITRTTEELSIICPTRRVPSDVGSRSDGWRCLKVQGPLDFSLIGVLHSITTPLAHAKLSLLAVATFDTDYVLIRSADLTSARRALAEAGHRVMDAPAGQ